MFQQLINGVPAGTRIVVAGISIGTDHVEPAQRVLKELDIRFSLSYTPEQFAETFTHLAAGDFDVATPLTGAVGLDGVADAFARLGTCLHDAKILLDPTR
jgi:threonine dehydrogenase-like Zn-dependent dehydrogenase